MQDAKEIRGLGDAIARATKAVGIRPCGGCEKRRQALNRVFPNPFRRPPAIEKARELEAEKRRP